MTELVTQPSISLVMPVFNEESTLAQVLHATVDTLRSEPFTFEIVAVDDGSSDGSFAILRSLQESYPGVLRVVQHIYNKGYGSALRTGIRCARGEVVVLMDADGQHDAKDVARLVALIPPYDMVVARRTESYQGHWYRNLGNRFYNRFASWLTNFPIEDLTSGFRAIRREAILHFLPLYPAGFSASLTATMAMLKAGYSVKFIPVEMRRRTGGQSKVNIFRDGSRYFTLMLRMVMLYDPMRLFTPLSALSVLLGVVAWVAGMLDEGRIFFSNVTIFFFFAAVFTFLMGLIASQLVSSRIYYHGDESIQVYDVPEIHHKDAEFTKKG
jgi:glycosyltransferase involved in cell wall biosynthesis